MDLNDAISIAKKARLNACQPEYWVGSCLVTKDGKAYSRMQYR